MLNFLGITGKPEAEVDQPGLTADGRSSPACRGHVCDCRSVGRPVLQCRSGRASSGVQRVPGTDRHRRCPGGLSRIQLFPRTGPQNILDWASRETGNRSSGGKPVALMGPGRYGHFRAQYHLRQVCVYLDLHPLQQAGSVCQGLLGRLRSGGNLVDARITGLVSTRCRPWPTGPTRLQGS